MQHRDTLEQLIENETRQKSTQAWLDVLEGCGLRKLSQIEYLFKTNKTIAYAAINDVQDSLNHEHGA